MTRSFGHRLLTLVAALLLAVVSVQSAARMAPGPADSPAVLSYLLAGGSIDDFCGGASDPSHGQHHCPFCRQLADPPQLPFAPREMALCADPAYAPLPADFRLGPQGGNPFVSARAPPTLA